MQARRWYRENGSTRDPHALIVAQKILQSALSGIGFDPAGRSKLGVAGTARHGPGGPAVAPAAVSRRTTVAVATAGADPALMAALRRAADFRRGDSEAVGHPPYRPHHCGD